MSDKEKPPLFKSRRGKTQPAKKAKKSQAQRRMSEKQREKWRERKGEDQVTLPKAPWE